MHSQSKRGGHYVCYVYGAGRRVINNIHKHLLLSSLPPLCLALYSALNCISLFLLARAAGANAVTVAQMRIVLQPLPQRPGLGRQYPPASLVYRCCRCGLGTLPLALSFLACRRSSGAKTSEAKEGSSRFKGSATSPTTTALQLRRARQATSVSFSRSNTLPKQALAAAEWRIQKKRTTEKRERKNLLKCDIRSPERRWTA